MADTKNPNLLSPEEVDEIRSRFINGIEYEKLNPAEQQNYRRIICDDPTILTLIQLLTKYGALGSLLGPIYTLYSRMPQPNILDKISSILNVIITFLKMIDSLSSLEDLPVIGTVFKKMHEMFLLVVKVIGSLITTILMLVTLGPVLITQIVTRDIPQAYKYAKEQIFPIEEENGKTIEKLSTEFNKEYFKFFLKKDSKLDNITTKILKDMLQPAIDIKNIYNICMKLKEKFYPYTIDGWDAWWNVSVKQITGLSLKEILNALFSQEPIPPTKDIFKTLKELSDLVSELDASTYIEEKDYKKYKAHIEAMKNKKSSGIFDEVSSSFKNASETVKKDWDKYVKTEEQASKERLQQLEEYMKQKKLENETALEEVQESVNTITTKIQNMYKP